MSRFDHSFTYTGNAIAQAAEARAFEVEASIDPTTYDSLSEQLHHDLDIAIALSSGARRSGLECNADDARQVLAYVDDEGTELSRHATPPRIETRYEEREMGRARLSISADLYVRLQSELSELQKKRELAAELRRAAARYRSQYDTAFSLDTDDIRYFGLDRAAEAA